MRRADPEVIRVGVDYLHIVTPDFGRSGVTFVSAIMFQAMGNTLPSLMTSFIRMAIGVIPAWGARSNRLRHLRDGEFHRGIK